MIHTPASAARHPQQPTDNTRLRGRWLVLARAGWLVIVTATLALFAGSLPVYYALIQKPCGKTTFPCGNLTGGLDTAGLRALQAAGFSASAHAAYIIALTIAIGLVWVTVGLLIFWRRSDDWVALLAALALLIAYVGQTAGVTSALAYTSSFWSVPVEIINFLSEAAGILFFCVFPSGRFAPRWMRWVLAFFLLISAFSTFPPADSPFNSINWPPILNALGNVVIYGLVIFSQIYRYRRLSTPAQRQQTKWVLFGIIFSLVLLSGVFVFSTLAVPPLNSPLVLPFELASDTSWLLAFLPIPIFIGLAILRSRLWDIDTLINQALVYGSLTALLGALYAGLIIGLQALASILTGLDQSPLALVISTLAIAALFQPARRRLQNLIDRRFYRQKYDAEKALAAFSATLRSEVDLEEVRAQLLAVVQETMQPAHVSLWLRLPERQPTDLDR
ncbi:MAG TPA: hypothetical protein VKT82_09445 [Ktedonobacterales bacterium]|nr:hypothetical protein [Ktedonobacterales bacterium]